MAKINAVVPVTGPEASSKEAGNSLLARSRTVSIGSIYWNKMAVVKGVTLDDSRM